MTVGPRPFIDVPSLVARLVAAYPGGLSGGRSALAGVLERDLGPEVAARTSQRLVHGGHAHYIPGRAPLWIFSRLSVSFEQLVRALRDEFRAFVAPDESARDEAVSFIGRALRVDRETARELLTGLEASGIADLVYDPVRHRDRMRFTFPISA